MKVHRTKLENLIKGTRGKIFSCVFIKKDGSIRRMTCRLGVTKYIKGTGKPISNITNSYVTVFDLSKKSYRVINIDTINNITIGGLTYNVKG